MIAIALGRIAVPTAGTPVPLTLTPAQQLQLSAAGQCAKVEVWPDPAATGTVYVKQGAAVLAALPEPSSGYPLPWHTPDECGNAITPGAFSLDAATSADGAYVTLWVR